MERIVVPQVEAPSYPACKSLENLSKSGSLMANAVSRRCVEEGVSRLTIVVTGTSGAYLAPHFTEELNGVDWTCVQVAKKNRRDGNHHRDPVEGYMFGLGKKEESRVLLLDDCISTGTTINRVQSVLSDSQHIYRCTWAVIYGHVSVAALKHNAPEIEVLFSSYEG